MKTFHMQADGLFMAENIDDAFRVLSEHFARLSNCEEGLTIFLPGSTITIQPELAVPDLEQENELGPLARAATGRPAGFARLTAEERWAIDKSLGILDWDGDPRK